MGLLLDTHTFLWSSQESPRLGRQALRRISDRSVVVFLSVVSIWEISIKISLGKLEVQGPLDTALTGAIEAGKLQPLGVTLDHALAVRSLPFHHRDPFDRMLIAQAKVEGLTIVTADTKFALYDVPVIDATK